MTTTDPTPDVEPDVESTPDAPHEPAAEPVQPPVEPIEARAEIVKRPEAAVVETTRESALDRAAEAAMQMPGVPGRDEFLSLAMQARVLSMSGLTPPAIRGNPHNAFYIAMVGRDLGLSPTAALELIDVIGRDGRERASLSPQLMNAQIRRLGLGSIIPIVRTAERCVAGAFGPGGADARCKREWAKGTSEGHVDDCSCDLLGTTEFTWDDARMAQLVGVDCTPTKHTDKCVANSRDTAQRFKCQQGYRTYPKRMMWWRAGGYAADDYFPEAGLGLYSPEELGAMVDDEGRPIDPATVSVPDGYEPAAPPERPDANAAADVDELIDLQLRVRALPEAQQTSIRERWKQLASLQGCSLWNLPARRVQLVRSLVSGAESAASKAGWDATAAQLAAREEVGAALAALLHGVDGAAVEQTSDEQTSDVEPEAKPEPEPPTWLADDIAVRNADPDDDMVINHSDAVEVSEVIARVQELPNDVVDASLRAHKIRVAGNVDLRRRRLVLAMLRERRAREHAARVAESEAETAPDQQR